MIIIVSFQRVLKTEFALKYYTVPIQPKSTDTKFKLSVYRINRITMLKRIVQRVELSVEMYMSVYTDFYLLLSV